MSSSSLGKYSASPSLIKHVTQVQYYKIISIQKIPYLVKVPMDWSLLQTDSSRFKPGPCED